MISNKQIEWASKKKQDISPQIIQELISDQEGKCALTKVELIFDVLEGTPTKNKGCHALYATVDHKSPSKKNDKNVSKDDVQIICYAINDMKGHLPKRLFESILKTEAWQIFIAGWKSINTMTAKRIMIISRNLTT